MWWNRRAYLCLFSTVPVAETSASSRIQLVVLIACDVAEWKGVPSLFSTGPVAETSAGERTQLIVELLVTWQM